VSALTQSQAQNAPEAGAPNVGPLSTAPFANLKLTTQEQTAIQSILQSAQKNGAQSFAQLAGKIGGVLTPAQQSTFQSDLKALQAQHHRYHGSGARSSTTISDVAARIGVQSQLQSKT
jgi:hypothetical protein